MTSRENVLMALAMTFATDTRVSREAKTLARNGFEVQVLCWDRQGRRPPTEMIDQCLVRNIRFGKTSPLPYPRLYYLMVAFLFQAATFFWVLREIRRARNLILHAHDFNTLPGCVIAKLLFNERIRLIYDCHELTPGVYQEWYGSFVSAIVARLEFAALKRVDAIVTSNEAIRSHLRRGSGAPVIVIHNCPAIGEVPKIPPSEAKMKLGLSGSFVVLFSGKIRQDYDLDMIMDAARGLSQSDLKHFRFVFIGLSETKTVASLCNIAANEGLRAFFDFRGWVPNEEWLLYYMASDLCFAVTRDLGPNTRILTPNRIFESMACGVPVIVRDGTLAAEMIRSIGCGIVANVGHFSFSTELLRLSQNREVLRALGAAGQKAFRATYNWDQMQAKLLELYDRIHV